jgi:hypothetical protein
MKLANVVNRDQIAMDGSRAGQVPLSAQSVYRTGRDGAPRCEPLRDRIRSRGLSTLLPLRQRRGNFRAGGRGFTRPGESRQRTFEQAISSPRGAAPSTLITGLIPLNCRSGIYASRP